LTKRKHYRGSDIQKGTGSYIPEKKDFNIETYNYLLDYAKKNYNIENDFAFYTHRSRTDLIYYGQNTFKYDEESSEDCYHHDAHTWSAYMQSPFDSAFVLSWDGGGDGTCFQVSLIESGKMVWSEKKRYDFGSVYQFIFGDNESFKNTDPLDIAGKIMGLSAYGKVYDFLFPQIDRISRYKRFPKNLNDLWKEIPDNDVGENYRKYKIQCAAFNQKTVKALYEKIKEQEILLGITIEEKDIAATTQAWFETRAVEIIREKYYSKIKESSNLIITGGCALNVLVNQKIKDTFTDINVYVPPNPHDGGLSVGMVYKYLNENGCITRGKKYDLSNSGPDLFDIENWKDHIVSNERHTKINLRQLSKVIKSGRIIGLIQGNMEIGPRALGRRSIICDPSIPDMKDKINSNVKFREEYRPFAPVCRIEDAHKYFDAKDFDNTEAMAYTVIVKDEYREKLKSITHEDNTARLQTVTEESDPVMYELLSHLPEPRVLLNTSFNVQGQPILNRLSSAAAVLERTNLDAYAVKHGEEFFYFFK
jgi:carbamoyltransferase